MILTRWLGTAGFLCLFVLLVASPAAAQYRFDHWTTDNGLPQNSVRDIVQTRDGYIWFTTFDGLVRFDGVRFTVFNKSNSPELASNRFVHLFEDRFGDLWATVETGQVLRRHQGRFTLYGREQGLPDDPNPILGDDGEGNVVVSIWNFEATYSPVTYPKFSSRAYRLRDGRFQPADELNYSFSESLWLGEESRGLAVGHVSDGDLWNVTTNWVIRLLKGGGFRIFREGHGLPGTSAALIWGNHQPMQAASRDVSGRLWLTDLKSGQSRVLSPQTPPGFHIWRGFADNEGNYWFGSYGNGLFRARRQTVTPYGKAQGLDNTEIYPMLEGRDGSIWIGTGGDLFRLRDGTFSRYVGDDSFYFGSVSSLYEDRAGQLWVNGGWRPEGNRLVRAPWAKTVPDSFMSVNWTMCEDGDGAYWIGSSSGVVRHLNGVNTFFTTKDGLAGNDTKVIIQDGKGGLWLGSYGGLTHYKNGKFTAWTEKDGLPGNTVRALKPDADGTLWIGTYDSGLGRFKDGRFTRYTMKDGLFDSGVFQILEDDYGWFWMSCNRGIYRVRKQELLDFAEGRIKTLNSLLYNEGDGLPSSECNGGRWPAGVKTRDGKLWFPTMRGVAMIDPATIKSNAQPPPVLIEGMRINNERVPLDDWDAATHNPQSDIKVLPGQDNFEIEYTALSFINSENMRFKYKLEGADNNWVEAGTRRTAYFSHLAPGAYTFRVIAANADGVWNETGASLRINIVPSFWRTWWFLTVATLAIVGVVATAWKYRVTQLKRVQLAQQTFARQLIASQESERKRIAGELHDSLGQSLVIIRNWALLGAGQLQSDAPAREELDEINAIASRSINEVREIAYNLGPYHLERLGFENSVREMVKRVAHASGIAIATELDSLAGALSRDTELSLYRIAQEALNNLVKHSRATEARVVLKHEPGGVRLTVDDNGMGFNPQTPISQEHPGGFGLNGMAERVRLLGGALTIHSVPGQGTTVEALLPKSHETPEVKQKNG